MISCLRVRCSFRYVAGCNRRDDSIISVDAVEMAQRVDQRGERELELIDSLLNVDSEDTSEWSAIVDIESTGEHSTNFADQRGIRSDRNKIIDLNSDVVAGDRSVNNVD